MLRGRDDELARIEAVLQRLKDHAPGGIVIIEGDKGTGKSLLLDHACRRATELRIGTALVLADEFLRIIPLMPLYASMNAVPPSLENISDASQRLITSIEHFRSRVEQHLSSGPLIIAVDDTHLADPSSLLALRTLSTQMKHRSVAWFLARRTGYGGEAIDKLFGRLRREKTTTAITLGPLDGEALHQVLVDRLGSEPPAELQELLSTTGGNPYLLTQFVEGLLEEETLRIRHGRAELTPYTDHTPFSLMGDGPPIPFPLPERLRKELTHNFSKISSRTFRLLQIGAVLGQSFDPEVCARMIGESTANCLPHLCEAMEANLIFSNGEESFEFQDRMCRQAILDSIPSPLRRSLHREAAEIMLARPATALLGVRHLALGARQGDSETITILSEKARESLAHSPKIAAELAHRCLDLVPPNSNESVDLTITALEAAFLYGPFNETTDLGRKALANVPPGPRRPRLQCALARTLLLTEQFQEVLELVEPLLDPVPGICDDVRAEARLLHMCANATRSDDGPPPWHSSPAENAPLSVFSSAVIEGRNGNIERALDALSRLRTPDTSPQPHTMHLLPLLQAGILISARETTQATRLLTLLQEESTSPEWRVLQTAARALHSELHLVEGRLETAAELAADVINTAKSLAMPSYVQICQSVLTAVALHTGDATVADDHLPHLRGATTDPESFTTPDAHARALWHTARVVEADAGPEEALRLLTANEGTLTTRHLMLIAGPTAAPWLVRLGRHLQDHALIDRIVSEAGDLADDNPSLPVFRTSHEHALGLATGDTRLLRKATESPDRWATASAHEDLAHTVREDEDPIVHLKAALSIYDGFGAKRDAARVRNHLRKWGVRQRHWSTAARPEHGWESLTETERAVALQVSMGLTNRQVAGRMFLSPHTVGFHLRQIYRKLGIHSRVDLARHVHTHSSAPTALITERTPP
ncbi:AAA family ATPase (plasmid) [Nocardiopsis flavescens]|uniref:LooR n=1 Tax=Nocardiopsis flavescens TaxID=758803 RepID=A0A6M5K9A9_9ACTN|nr:LooR [Nocardiopsis flavescens]QKW32427.1 AAA family ATPase [Nocardiopsis flavescens]